ncbi:MAG: monovalent cation/H(+) antiporter subunit G, partial [Acidimicrobiia bacterium]
MIADLLLLAGSLLILVAAIGVLRFRDVFVRMHASAKASAAGILLVLLGAAIGAATANDVTSLLLAALLQVVTLP